jgi:hypothetical protein
VRRWSNPIPGGVQTSWMAGLLAGLILAVHLGAPPVGRGMLRAVAPIGPRCADPVAPDSESAEDEAPTSEVDPLVFARGRSLRLSPSRGDRSPGFLRPWAAVSASRSRRQWLVSRARAGQEPPGHFLAEGRPLRHWIQSLTC